MYLPGPGVGGHCLPKGIWLWRYGVKTYGANGTGGCGTGDAAAGFGQNHQPLRPEYMVRLVYKAPAHHAMALGKARLAILGVSYLENRDDVRNRPAYDLIN